MVKRRLDAIEGNVGSYSRCLNDPKRLAAIKDLEIAKTKRSLLCQVPV